MQCLRMFARRCYDHEHRYILSGLFYLKHVYLMFVSTFYDLSCVCFAQKCSGMQHLLECANMPRCNLRPLVSCRGYRLSLKLSVPPAELSCPNICLKYLNLNLAYSGGTHTHAPNISLNKI